MNADPRVMAYFPTLLSRAESDALAARIEAGFQADGFGLWAVERLRDRAFLGFTGLKRVPFEAEFTPAVEVGWRFAAFAWRQGYATEAARMAIRVGFEGFDLPEIVSFTAMDNAPSVAVMERLGMAPAGAFDHPALPPGHRLRRHRLYRLARGAWQPTAGGATA